jgi:hypothetical protein
MVICGRSCGDMSKGAVLSCHNLRHWNFSSILKFIFGETIRLRRSPSESCLIQRPVDPGVAEFEIVDDVDPRHLRLSNSQAAD